MQLDLQEPLHIDSIICNGRESLPLTLSAENTKLKIFPTTQWKTTRLKAGEAALIREDGIKKMYYIGVKQNS